MYSVQTAYFFFNAVTAVVYLYMLADLILEDEGSLWHALHAWQDLCILHCSLGLPWSKVAMDMYWKRQPNHLYATWFLLLWLRKWCWEGMSYWIYTHVCHACKYVARTLITVQFMPGYSQCPHCTFSNCAGHRELIM